MRSVAFSLNFQYSVFSLRSFSSCLRFHCRLSFKSIPPSILPSTTCLRIQLLRKMWTIQCFSLLHDHPFVTLLPRRAQSGRRSSSEKRMWFTESHLVFVVFFFYFLFYLLNLFLLQSMESYIQLKNYFISRKLTQSLLCTPTYTTLVRDWLPHWTASVRYQLPTVLVFKSLPSYLSPTVLNIYWQINLQRMAMNRP